MVGEHTGFTGNLISCTSHFLSIFDIDSLCEGELQLLFILSLIDSILE